METTNPFTSPKKPSGLPGNSGQTNTTRIREAGERGGGPRNRRKVRKK